MINREIMYRIGDLVLIRGTITAISQQEGGQPVYTLRLSNGSTSVTQNHIAGVTADVPNDRKDEDADENT